jgi:hypothetical protein
MIENNLEERYKEPYLDKKKRRFYQGFFGKTPDLAQLQQVNEKCVSVYSCNDISSIISEIISLTIQQITQINLFFIPKSIGLEQIK